MEIEGILCVCMCVAVCGCAHLCTHDEIQQDFCKCIGCVGRRIQQKQRVMEVATMVCQDSRLSSDIKSPIK